MVGEYDDNQKQDDEPIIVQQGGVDDNSVTTEDIPNYIPYLDEPLDKDGKNVILMMLPGQATPITFEDVPSIILGRYDQTTGIYPTVDLTPYFGKTHGVSRRHAEIFLHEGYYYLRDLDSANGTWLNNKKVTRQPHLIKSGDQVRLGELLIVLFLSEKAIPSSMKHSAITGQHTLHLQSVKPEQKLLPDSLDINFIRHTLMPYLNVLNDIQATILDITQQDPTPITISSLHAISKPNTIELQLYIYPQLLFFLRDHVQKWVNKGEQEKDDTFLAAVYRRSAKDMLAQLTPTTTANDLYTTYVERLQTDIQKLFGFDLKIVTMLES